jgi:xylulokinase
MDSSTGAQCKALEAEIGGAEALAALTGSRAYERFTGNQVAKLAAQDGGAAYADTERVSLISSFMPSLLMGAYCPIDLSDAGGMNMLDLHEQDWSERAVAACAPGLLAKLGPVAPSHTVAGTASPYLQQRFGFGADCQVVTWSGDNPCSVAGLGLQLPGDIGLSMGTSDTIFGITGAGDSRPALEGHVFVNPVDPASHMIMLCYKNGSLCRERVCERATGSAGDWEAFDALLARTAPGNGGRVGFFFDQPEITPDVPRAGQHFFDAQGAKVEGLSPEAEARAVLEGQFLSMRLHGGDLGLHAKRVIATGGASQNASITQVIADVFGVPVLAASQPDSASLGAAYRAMHANACAAKGAFVPFGDVVGDLASGYTQVATPNAEAHAAYTAMLGHYAACESTVRGL